MDVIETLPEEQRTRYVARRILLTFVACMVDDFDIDAALFGLHQPL